MIKNRRHNDRTIPKAPKVMCVLQCVCVCLWVGRWMGGWYYTWEMCKCDSSVALCEQFGLWCYNLTHIRIIGASSVYFYIPFCSFENLHVVTKNYTVWMKSILPSPRFLPTKSFWWLMKYFRSQQKLLFSKSCMNYRWTTAHKCRFK